MLIGVAIALIGGARALVEYQKKVAQDRFQMLMKMQESFHSNESFRRIRGELDGQSSFDGMSKAERAEYATFFEDVALLRRGGLLRPELAFYMRLYGAGKTRNFGKGWIVTTNGGVCFGRSPLASEGEYAFGFENIRIIENDRQSALISGGESFQAPPRHQTLTGEEPVLRGCGDPACRITRSCPTPIFRSCRTTKQSTFCSTRIRLYR